MYIVDVPTTIPRVNYINT